MQSEPYGDMNYSVQDYLVKKVNDRDMKYNWLLGYNAGKWTAAENYKKIMMKHFTPVQQAQRVLFLLHSEKLLLPKMI